MAKTNNRLSQVMPQVSVIMPAYNSASYIAEAIESILQQDYKDFEFIIINDGSTDDTEKIIKSFTDPRIRYFSHEINKGNNYTRTAGVRLAKGKYIAIMDSDDIAVKERLSKQFNYLERHWETDFLGGAVESFGNGENKIENPLHSPEYIKPALLFRNRVFQPSMMFRKKSYDRFHLSWLPEWENMGDYELWYRAKERGLRIENLSDVLVKYRRSDQQIGSRNIKDREDKLLQFLKIRIRSMGIDFIAAEYVLLFSFLRGRIEVDSELFLRLKGILNKIEYTNNSIKKYERRPFRAAILFYYLKLGKYHYQLNRGNYFLYFLYLAEQFFHAGIRASILFFRNEL